MIFVPSEQHRVAKRLQFVAFILQDKESLGEFDADAREGADDPSTSDEHRATRMVETFAYLFQVLHETLFDSQELPACDTSTQLKTDLHLVLQTEGWVTLCIHQPFSERNFSEVFRIARAKFEELQPLVQRFQNVSARLLAAPLEGPAPVRQDRENPSYPSMITESGWTDWKPVADWRAVFDANGQPTDPPHFAELIETMKLESDLSPNKKQRRFRVIQLRLWGFKGF